MPSLQTLVQQHNIIIRIDKIIRTFQLYSALVMYTYYATACLTLLLQPVAAISLPHSVYTCVGMFTSARHRALFVYRRP